MERTNLLDNLKNLLQKDERLVSEGALLKNKTDLSINGLILTHISSQGFVLLLFYISFFTDKEKNGYVFSWNSVKEHAKRYKQFPKVSISSGLVNALSNRLPIIVLDFFFGKQILGQYTFTHRILSTPVSLVSAAIGDVFRQKASQEYTEKGSACSTYMSTLKGLSIFSVIAFVLIGIFAKDVLNMFFGDKWAMAGNFIRIMTVLFIFRFIASPLSFIMVIAEKLKTDLIWQICLCVFVAVTSLVGYYVWGTVTSVIVLFTVVYSIAYMISIIITYNLAKGKALEINKTTENHP